MAERENPRSSERWNRNYFLVQRRRMVTDQLQARGIKDARVLEAMEVVPREEFVLTEYRPQAYEDSPLPIGFGQTISQPYAVAYCVEALQLQGGEKVLELGTGSGYQAAVLSHLADVVHTMERVPQLYAESRERLGRLGYENVHVHFANGTLGLSEEAPFDAIIAAASSEELPLPLAEQLADGGRIVIPLGPHRRAQRLMRYTFQRGELHAEDLGSFAFVPLIGEYGWGEQGDAEMRG
jgi:protein-L-isoaspartate(D-aspartate) O-methyltransferase